MPGAMWFQAKIDMISRTSTKQNGFFGEVGGERVQLPRN